MNYADTEKIRYALMNQGFKEIHSIDDADVIILNTCSVRQRAEDKVLGLARKLTLKKRENPDVKIILTGCMAERLLRCGKNQKIDLAYLRRMQQKMPWINAFIGIGDFDKLGKVLGLENFDETVGKQQMYTSSISSLVPISSGCDNFCSYCVVPFSRGKEIYFRYEEIIEQVRSLVAKKYRLITLLGQNVNSWKGIIGGKQAAFPELLREIDKIKGAYWLTFLTSHPKDLSESLVNVMAEGDHLCPYLNLPAQSGSNKILEKMNRRYTREEYLNKIGLLKKQIPGIRLSTDVIVGFPGETKEDFEMTLKLMERVRYGMAYISEFSPREYSAAAQTKETVSAKEKSERKKCLEELQRKVMEEENRKALGTKVRVLVTANGKGILSDMREVEFSPDGIHLPGDFADAVVTSVSASGLRVSFVV